MTNDEKIFKELIKIFWLEIKKHEKLKKKNLAVFEFYFRSQQCCINKFSASKFHLKVNFS